MSSSPNGAKPSMMDPKDSPATSDTGSNVEHIQYTDVDNEKSHTFRKRRLTYTKHQLGDAASDAAAMAAALAKEDESYENGDIYKHGHSPSRKQQRVQNKKDQEDSKIRNHSSFCTSTEAAATAAAAAAAALEARIVHAGELVQSHPPTSPGMCPHKMRLYLPPFSLPAPTVPTINGGDEEQPEWKTRHTRHQHEHDNMLPFPRNVVGTYSCHGVEPVYDSDYAPEEEDDDDDDNNKNDNEDNTETTTTTAKDEEQESLKTSLSAKINQDRAGVSFPYGNCPSTALFAVFDGHGQRGELVSQFALHEIDRRLKIHPTFHTNLSISFKETFRQVDFALTKEPTIEPLYAGTTACVALLRDDVLTFANAGDSRAVLARKRNKKDDDADDTNYEVMDLTVDNNPDTPEEQERIENAGGFVSPPPEPGLSARVWLDSSFSMIGLAMSRSIGDHAVKTVGVIAEPVVSTYKLQEDDDFLIIATDGVWEFLESSEAVDIVARYIHEGATKACRKLIEEAAAKWHQEEGDYRDDITAVVIRLKELRELVV